MPVALGYTNPTGVNNAVSSIFKWLTQEVPEDNYTYIMTSQGKPAPFPHVEVTMFPSQSPGSVYAGGYIFPAGAQKYGALDSVMINFSVRARLQEAAIAGRPQNLNPLKSVRQIWDRIQVGLHLASWYHADNDVAPITLYDFDDGAADTETTLWVPFGDPGAIIQQYFFPTADEPNIHMLRTIVKFNWFKMFN